MLARILHVIVRIALLVAIVSATALVIDYSRDSHAFCGRGAGPQVAAHESGCEIVAASPLSHVGGVALPNIGLGVFAGLFLAAIAATRPGHVKLLAAMLSLAGLGALGLIGYQLFKLAALCSWCMAADASVVVAAIAAIAAARHEPPAEPWSVRLLSLCAAVAAVAAPWWWAGAPITRIDLPPAIASLQQQGCVRIVAFTDFQCPFCRKLHDAVHEHIAKAPDRYCLARMMVPLPSHAGAEPAARAYLCADPQRREAIADKLYRAEIDTMTKDGMVALYGEIGLDKEQFLQCYQDKATTAAIQRDTALYQKLDLLGLPATYVNDHLILGADITAFERAFDVRDIRWMFGLLVLVFAVAAAASLRSSGSAPRRAA